MNQYEEEKQEGKKEVEKEKEKKDVGWNKKKNNEGKEKVRVYYFILLCPQWHH